MMVVTGLGMHEYMHIWYACMCKHSWQPSHSQANVLVCRDAQKLPVMNNLNPDVVSHALCHPLPPPPPPPTRLSATHNSNFA